MNDQNDAYFNARAELERRKLSRIWNLCADREAEAIASFQRMPDGRPFPALVLIEELRQIIRSES